MNVLFLKVCIIVCFCCANSLFAQPFVDPLNIRYTHAFEGNNPKATPFSHIYVEVIYRYDLKTEQFYC